MVYVWENWGEWPEIETDNTEHEYSNSERNRTEESEGGEFARSEWLRFVQLSVGTKSAGSGSPAKWEIAPAN